MKEELNGVGHPGVARLRDVTSIVSVVFEGRANIVARAGMGTPGGAFIGAVVDGDLTARGR